MVANEAGSRRHPKQTLINLLHAQIENSFDLGWKKEDIVILSNFDFEYRGIKAYQTPLNKSCLTGSKVFGLKWYFNNGADDEPVWAHDLDCWQNAEFKCPKFKDAGAAYYSQPKFNGGSIFWRKSGLDILEHIVELIEKEKADREEPTLNKVFKSKEFKKRITVLNETFNLGCSGFVPRYERAKKPIRVCHFHPTNRLAWETHALDRNGLGEVAISHRLEMLIRHHYPKLAWKIKYPKKVK